MSALDSQIGGGHYKERGIQPVVYIHSNKLNFLEGCIVKRITRWRDKNGLEDLLKIKHEVDLLIELEGLGAKPDTAPTAYTGDNDGIAEVASAPSTTLPVGSVIIGGTVGGQPMSQEDIIRIATSMFGAHDSQS